MKKRLYKIGCLMVSLVVVLFIIQSQGLKSSASSKVVEKNIRIGLFDMLSNIYTTIQYGGSNDTPEGICAVGNVLYTTKIHTDGTTTLIKSIEKNGKVKHIMPEKNLALGHANDIAYYNGYLYIAGLNNKFYRVKDNGLNENGYERYTVKSYTCSNVTLSTDASRYSTASWNLTHYTGKYFIFCSSINSSRKLTFRVGYFNDSTNKFVVTKSFTTTAKAFTTIQGITYHNGYLYQTTSDNAGSGNMNKVSEYYIGTDYSKLGQSYSLAYYGTFDNLNVDKFEIESLTFDKNNMMYVLVNVAGKKDYIYKSKSTIQ